MFFSQESQSRFCCVRLALIEWTSQHGHVLGQDEVTSSTPLARLGQEGVESYRRSLQGPPQLLQ